jgi:hypothetical protein
MAVFFYRTKLVLGAARLRKNPNHRWTPCGLEIFLIATGIFLRGSARSDPQNHDVGLVFSPQRPAPRGTLMGLVRSDCFRALWPKTHFRQKPSGTENVHEQAHCAFLEILIRVLPLKGQLPWPK